MVAIRLPAVITEDRKLIIELPDDVPAGAVEVVIHTQDASQAEEGEIINPAREAARAKLAAAGLLSTAHRLPEGVIQPTEEEMYGAGVLPVGAPPSEELIDEDRHEAKHIL
jgi:hypothetical protein